MTHSRLSVAVGLLASTLLLPPLAQAAIITADGTTCTLTDAIRAANTDLVAGGCIAGNAADTILLTADESITGGEAFVSGSTNFGGANAGLPDIVSTITIQASGAGDRIERQASLTCDAGPFQSSSFRIFNVLSPANLTLVGITVANGCVHDTTNNVSGEGGGIFVLPGSPGTVSLTLQGSTLTGNTVRADGFGGPFARGGALSQVAGTLVVSGSTFSGNRVFGSRGEQTVGGAGEGGAISLVGAATAAIDTSSFSGNLAQGGSGLNQGGDGKGGALHTAGAAAITALTLSTFADNTARGTDGGSAFGGGLSLDGGDNGVFEQLTVRDNLAAAGASSNDSSGVAWGGGLFHSGLSLTGLRESHFTGNIAQGASATGSGGAASGGGLYIAGPLGQISDTTFSENRAQGGIGSFGGGAVGGGLHVGATVGGFRNSTVFANVALGGGGSQSQGGAAGGGLSVTATVPTFSHVTVTANQAQSQGNGQGGGLYRAGDDSFVVDNSVLADNIVTGDTTAGADCFSSAGLVSDGYNHAESPDPSCVFTSSGDVVGSDPLLGPFGDHGCTADRVLADGSCVPTVALSLASLPLDTGNCATSDADLDQRGFLRPADIAGVANTADACDKGAFELQGLEAGVDLAITKTGPASNPSVGTVFSFALTVTNQSTIAAGNGITVVDMIPGGLRFTGSDCGAVAASSPVAGPVTWTIGTLAPGATASCNLQFERLALSPISNQATVDGNEADPDPTDNVATAQLETAPVEPAPVAEIPTLGEWALLLFALALAAVAVLRLRV